MGFFRENFKHVKQMFHMNAVTREHEEFGGLKGELRFELREKGVLIQEYRHSNIIVNTASILIARLLKDSTEPSSGISFLAVGSGGQAWNKFDPPAPTTSQTRLENEFYRKGIDYATFIHPVTGEPTQVYTNIVDYSVTFGEAEGVGPVVEMGLFGGDATGETNSGTLVNWRTFPVINKTSTMTLTVIFRITA
jgi:hypothetical protein